MNPENPTPPIPESTESEQPLVPPAPPQPVPILKPTKRSAFDAEIERELEAALAGMDDKSLYGDPDASGGRKSPGAGSRTGGLTPPAHQGKKGRVISIHGDDIFIDVGGRSQGVISAIQFETVPAIGSEVDVTIEGYDNANGLLLLSRKGSAVQADWSSIAEGMIVEARVTDENKGGLQVDVNGIRGFIPISHIDLYRVEDVKQYVNQRLRCLVTEVNPAERNLVLSRRALLEKEREEARERLWGELEEGQVRTGIVRNIKDFGAFLDLGGVDGLLHVGEMSWTRTENAADLVKLGQQLQVVILKLDREKRKVSLGLKQLLPSPWDNLEEKYPLNTVVAGKVTRLMDFGAFVELEPGIEGLVHISELAPQRVSKVSNIVQVGQEVKARILKIDKAQRRISLSLKHVESEPAAEAQEETVEVKKPLPPHRMPLRGGL